MLVGIAKLAREGEVLAGKAKVEYRTLPARRWLNRCTGERMPFQWTINPYRGCEFGCKYCYARYTHEFMELRDPVEFERRIFAKDFDAAAFGRELRVVKPREWIAIGTATDPYQPAERRYGLTRRVLEVFVKRCGFRVAVTTKGDLISRDAGLLAEVGRRNQVRVTLTVTTVDAELARAVEPMAPRPDLRLGAVAALAREGVDVGVFASPVMPGLNDSEESLEGVARAAKAAGAVRFGAQLVFLRPCSFAVFVPFLAERYPGLVEAYRRTFERGAYVRGDVNDRLQARVKALREKHGLVAPPAEAWGQLGLFESGSSG